jgi:flagellar L-ring protein precursor FlgH
MIARTGLIIAALLLTASFAGAGEERMPEIKNDVTPVRDRSFTQVKKPALVEIDRETSEAESAKATKLRNIYGTKSMIAKTKACQVHDRVTIVINENTTAKHEGKTDLSRESSMAWELSKWFTLGYDKGGNLVATPRNGTQKPNIDLSTSSTHKGDSETENTQTFKSEVSGEVIEVLPNGHITVEARSRVTVQGETRNLIFTGRIDPKDLDTNSSIDAKFVIDKVIKFEGDGPVSRTQKEGWAKKLLDKISPF